MKALTPRRALPALLLCAALLAAFCAGALTGCASADLGKPLLKLDGQEISENMVQLLMARVKGNLASNGYSVSKDSFWDQVVSVNGTRYDEYTRQLVLHTAKEYLAGVVLFEEKGLTLPQATLDRIDQEIQDMTDAAGSVTALNKTLASFGVNVDILRALYIIEAKNTALKASLYGTDGSLISASAKQEYLNDNALAFRQILLRSYRYLYVTDGNGDDVYYLPNENNEKVSNIAYDKETGHTRTDKDGKTMLYGHDTGLFVPETMAALKGRHLDFVMLDCTCGDEAEGTNHMGFSDDVIMRDRLRENGNVDDSTKLVITHFSHNGHLLHEELEKLANPEGFDVAYDGVVYEI